MSLILERALPSILALLYSRHLYLWTQVTYIKHNEKESPLPNLVPRASVVEREVEGPGNGWLSHDQIFQYSRKIFLATSRVLNFCNKFSKYIGKFGHVTTSLCQGLLPHVPPQRPWERGCPLPRYINPSYQQLSH